MTQSPCHDTWPHKPSAEVYTGRPVPVCEPTQPLEPLTVSLGTRGGGDPSGDIQYFSFSVNTDGDSDEDNISSRDAQDHQAPVGAVLMLFNICIISQIKRFN